MSPVNRYIAVHTSNDGNVAEGFLIKEFLVKLAIIGPSHLHVS